MCWLNDPLNACFRLRCRVVVLVLLACIPLAGFAGSLRIVPVSVVLDSEKKRGSLTIVNTGDEKLTVQMQMMKWTQDTDGKDVYELTKDLVFFPQIVTIDAGKEATVRVGYPSEGALLMEKCYRLFVQEIPVSQPGVGVIKTLMRISLPVFVATRNPLSTLTMEDPRVADGKLLVRIRNNGNSHSMIRKITVAGLDESETRVFEQEVNGWYLLAGVSKVFAIGVAGGDCQKAKVIKITASTTEHTVEAKLDLNEKTCSELAGNGN